MVFCRLLGTMVLFQMVLIHNLGSFPGEIWNCPLHCRLVGGNFNKQGNLQTRFVFSDRRMSRSLPCLPEPWRLYRSLNWVQSCIPYRRPQQHLILSKPYSCKWLPLREWWAERTSHPRGGRKEPLIAQVHFMGQLVVKSSQWPPTVAGILPGCCVPNEGGWLLYWPYSLGTSSVSLPDFQVHDPWYIGLHQHPGNLPPWRPKSLYPSWS